MVDLLLVSWWFLLSSRTEGTIWSKVVYQGVWHLNLYSSLFYDLSLLRNKKTWVFVVHLLQKNLVLQVQSPSCLVFGMVVENIFQMIKTFFIIVWLMFLL